MLVEVQGLEQGPELEQARGQELVLEQELERVRGQEPQEWDSHQMGW